MRKRQLTYKFVWPDHPLRTQRRNTFPTNENLFQYFNWLYKGCLNDYHPFFSPVLILILMPSRPLPDVGSYHINVSSSFSCNLSQNHCSRQIITFSFKTVEIFLLITTTKKEPTTTQIDILSYSFIWMSDCILSLFFNMLFGAR